MIERKLTPMKAIRQNCIDCSCGSLKDVKECIIKDCTLYQYRFGKNPRRKGVGNLNPKWEKRRLN